MCLGLLIASSSPALAESAGIFDMCDWENDHLNYDDAVLERCIAAKDTWDILAGMVRVRQESSLDNDPAASLLTWQDLVAGSTAVDITSHGGSGGSLAAEFYADETVRDAVFDQYTHEETGGYGVSQIRVGTVVSPPDTAYTITWKAQGISDFLSSAALGISSRAILFGDYCASCTSAYQWGLDFSGSWWPIGGAMFCYTESQPSDPLTDYRENLYGAMSSLGCYVLGRDSSVGDAEDEITEEGSDVDITVLGDRESSYHLDEDCHNPAAAFDGAFAFDGKIVFRTAYEAGSICHFVMGVDSWRDVNVKDWTSWDVLARVRPEGGRGVAQLYEVDDVPDKAAYRIVEVDRYGRPTFSPVFVHGAKPAAYDEWLAHPAVVAVVDNKHGMSSGLYHWVSGRRVRYGHEFTSPGEDGHTGSSDGGPSFASRADSSGCADIIVYTNADYDSLLLPVEDHLSHYSGKKVLYFLGSSSLADAQTCYGDVHSSNVAYNQATGTDRFPTDAPGPLLLLVGDSYPSIIVSHDSFPDEHDRCQYPCFSDRDATDVLGSGPIGLVHRIPADTVAEVERACAGAYDWNRGDHVDPNWSTIEVVGNRLGDSITEWPIEMADDAASKFMGMGCLAKPPLVEGDYPYSQQGTLDKWADFDAQLDDGAAMLWGFGRVTDALYDASYGGWAGHFVHKPDTTANRTQQRIVAMMPGCTTVGVWKDNTYVTSLVERWMYFDPRFTQIVGTVGHLTGGWEHQHRKAEELYMDAWREAPKDAPLDWVVWRATQMAEEQGLYWMEDYFRSAATIGGYVLARPGGGWSTSAIVTEADSLVFCPSGCGQSHADSITIIVTVKDKTTGIPVVGKPPEDIRVSAWSEEGFSLVCEDTCYILPCLHPPSPTDENGQAFIPLNRAGGHGPGAFLSVNVNFPASGYSIGRTIDLEAKSPDINGDGSVDPIDFGRFGTDFSEGVGWRSDFDYDGDVDPIDFARFSAHFGHSCGSRQTSQIPPELLAQLGLAPPGVEGDQLPAVYDLDQNTPNPFNPVTSVRYAVPRPGGRVKIEVFDVAGRHVTTLVDAEKEPGWYVAAWDGTDDEGHRVSSSVYFCRMEAAGFSESRKLALVK